MRSAEELKHCRDGEFVKTAGCVIARQRPGTAKGFIFISMEDETDIANEIITPDLYDRDRLVVTRSKFLLVEGPGWCDPCESGSIDGVIGYPVRPGG